MACFSLFADNSLGDQKSGQFLHGAYLVSWKFREFYVLVLKFEAMLNTVSCWQYSQIFIDKTVTVSLTRIKTKNALNTVKHFLFGRTLFSRKFARSLRRENMVLTNNFNVRIIKQNLTNRENKASWIYLGWWPRENKVTRIISVLQ